MLSPTYHLRGDYHTRAYEHVKSLPRSRRLRPAGGLPYTLLRNLLRLLALRPVCGAPRFDRNLTATGYLSLSLPIPLRELRLDKSAFLSFPVPLCRSLSLSENDYESEGRRFESCRAHHIDTLAWSQTLPFTSCGG